jgi:hypothetical protein
MARLGPARSASPALRYARPAVVDAKLLFKEQRTQVTTQLADSACEGRVDRTPPCSPQRRNREHQCKTTSSQSMKRAALNNMSR